MRPLKELITFILVLETISVLGKPTNLTSVPSVADKITELVHDKCPSMQDSPFVRSNLEFLELCKNFDNVMNITENKLIYDNYARCYLYYKSLENLCSLKQLDNATGYKFFNNTNKIVHIKACDILHNNTMNDKVIKLYFEDRAECERMCIEPGHFNNKACMWAAYIIQVAQNISSLKPDTSQHESEKIAPTGTTVQKNASFKIIPAEKDENSKVAAVETVVEAVGVNNVLQTTSEPIKSVVEDKSELVVTKIIDAPPPEITTKKNITSTVASKEKTGESIVQPVVPKVVTPIVRSTVAPATADVVISKAAVEETLDKSGEHGIPGNDPDTQDEFNVELDDEEDNEGLQAPPANPEPLPHESEKPVEMSKPRELNGDLDIPTNNADPIDDDSYFFSYFMMVCIVFIMGYVGYHNKQKILAMVLEGRRGKRQHRRRPNSANYHKLDSNLEEAVTSSCNKNTTNVIY